MKFKDVLKFEKENMPGFQWKYEKFLLVFLFIWLGGAIVAAVLALIIGFATRGKGIYLFIPVIIWGIALAATLVVFVVKTRKIKAQLPAYYVEKLSREFHTIDYDAAKKKLADKNKITENGFVIQMPDPYEDKVIPFENVKILFGSRMWGGKFFVDFVLQDENGETYGKQMDNYYYNFLLNNMNLVANQKVFRLFCDNKPEFVRLMMKYNNVVKVAKRLDNL